MTQKEMLDEVVNWFSADPENRRSTKGVACLYNPPKNKPESKGCAIGMFIPDESSREKLDKVGGITVVFVNPYLKILLPDWMQQMDVNFLSGVQQLHDDPSYWDLHGLTQNGKSKLEQIKHDYL